MMLNAKALRDTMQTPGWVIIQSEAERAIEKHRNALMTCPLGDVELHRQMIAELTAFFAWLIEQSTDTPREEQ